MNILGQYSNGEVYAAYESAKDHEKEKGHPYTLCTVHSSKGLEWDKVIFADDMNKSIAKIIDDKEKTPSTYSPNELESMNLYYVGCSRAIKELMNAKHLPHENLL